jgi:hypothetical protein
MKLREGRDHLIEWINHRLIAPIERRVSRRPLLLERMVKGLERLWLLIPKLLRVLDPCRIIALIQIVLLVLLMLTDLGRGLLITLGEEAGFQWRWLAFLLVVGYCSYTSWIWALLMLSFRRAVDPPRDETEGTLVASPAQKMYTLEISIERGSSPSIRTCTSGSISTVRGNSRCTSHSE